MKFPSKNDLKNSLCLFRQTNNMQKFRIALYFCIILMMMTGMAAAADRDVIIGFKNKPGPSEEALIHSNGGVVKKSFHLIPAIAAKLPEGNITKLKKEPRIAYIENEKTYKPTDDYSNSWGVTHIGSQLVHENGITGKGVNISVLDTGIDYTHPDLIGNYKGGVSFVDYTQDPFDDSGHGTHVTGIIAAKNNGIGVVGVAPDANIYAVKVLHPTGGITSWVISGIEWAVDNKMDIATMSINCVPDPLLDPDCGSIALQNALDNAYYNFGLLLIASGGNTKGKDVQYPALYDSVIAVTATDQNDINADSSPNSSKIELAAPGVNILSTVPTGGCLFCNPTGYGSLSGTSMATPHVTGVAALIISNGFGDVTGDNLINNEDVRAILDNTAKDIGTPGRDSLYGFGLVDAAKATLGYSAVDVTLNLVRTTGAEINNAKDVNLSQGNYSVSIHNTNLSKLDMKVYQNEVLRKDLSSSFKFNKSNNVVFDLNVVDKFRIVFIPYGSKGSVGDVTIKSI